MDNIQAQRGRFTVLIFVNFVFGLVLLVLGGLAVHNTKGEKYTITVGPPYFLGAFIVGCAMVLSALTDAFAYRNTGDPTKLLKLSEYISIDVVLTGISLVGALSGIIIVSKFGVTKCDPVSIYGMCNYNINVSTNRKIAIAILIILLVSGLIGIKSIIVHIRACKGLGPYNTLKFLLKDSNETSQHTEFTPVDQANTTGESGNQIEDQNRLLREQIALQQQQIQLLQQQQEPQSVSASALPTEPPSYESCTQDPAEFKIIQEGNEELQNGCPSQQHKITENIAFSDDRQAMPTAPPL